MKTILKYFLLLMTVLSCQSPEHVNAIESEVLPEEKLPYFTYAEENLFPGDGSLLRAEDGIFLGDGRIVVVDQAHGLRLIEKNGSNRPFGDFKSAGYEHLPPSKVSAPNGVILESDGQHIITSDVSNGKIYRVTVATEEVEMIHDHPYGVNTIYRDQTGALWFSQSTHSTNMVELFKDLDNPEPHGAVFRMADLKSEPVKMIDSLYFANGITMDQDEKNLYVCETLMDRVHQFEVNVNEGSTHYKGVVARVGSPDNILVDQKGRLVVASPLFNQVVVIDMENHSQQVLFDGSSELNSELSREWDRRNHLGEKLMDLFTPALFQPLPGLLTGMFLSTDQQTLYICNLGNDLLKYEFD